MSVYYSPAVSRGAPRREKKFDPFAAIHPHIKQMLKAEVSPDTTPHQLRQELRVLRELLMVERQKVNALKDDLQYKKATAPHIYSGWDVLTGNNQKPLVPPPPKGMPIPNPTIMRIGGPGGQPRQKAMPQQYTVSRSAADEIYHSDHLPDHAYPGFPVQGFGRDPGAPPTANGR